LQDARGGRIAVESHADIANAILQAITLSTRATENLDDARPSRVPWDPLVASIRARLSARRRDLALPRSREQT
jgi:hypothetical protein